MGRSIDLSVWQLGWIWLLVPLTLAGDRHPDDYFLWWVLLNVASFTHRQLTFIVVYMNAAVFARFPRRFWIGALLLIGGFSGSMGLLLTASTPGKSLLVVLIAASALLLEFADDLWLHRPLRLFGVRTEVWLYAWTVWSSLLHFWYDGFLWKRRDLGARLVLEAC